MAEVFICDAIRTPFGRYGGALSGVRADDLAAIPLAALASRNPGVDWDAADDVILGCANQSGEDNRNLARMALLLAGLPQHVPGATVNRLCASGLDAILQGARAIRAGDADLIVAGGAESMSRAPFVMGKPEKAFDRSMTLEDTTMGWRFVNPKMRQAYGVDTMPETAENLAEKFAIARHDQDAFAFRSQRRARDATAAGSIAADLVAVDIPQRKGPALVVDADEQPRPETTLDGLAALPAPFRRDGGTVTAGNASALNDGAAAVILASEAAIARHGLTPWARLTAGAASGVEPRLMGVGPVDALARITRRTGLGIEDFDVIELNEAFAAQVLACLRLWGLPDDAAQVNPNGGAIAFGHPLGASGARLVIAAIGELKRRKAKRALVTLCVGVGQGLAAVLERV